MSKNVSQFTTWLFESQTPIVIASLVFFVAPQWIDATRVTCPRVLLGGVMLAVLLSYVFYLPFDGWTYLRFLLPMWPPLMPRSPSRWTRPAGAGCRLMRARCRNCLRSRALRWPSGAASASRSSAARSISGAENENTSTSAATCQITQMRVR